MVTTVVNISMIVLELEQKPQPLVNMKTANFALRNCSITLNMRSSLLVLVYIEVLEFWNIFMMFGEIW